MRVLGPPDAPAMTQLPGRLVAAGIAAACLTVITLGAWLEPDPAGVGTTSRLGIDTCSFLTRTGLPCGGCGLTTSVNHAVRLELLRSAWVHPVGLVFAIVVAAVGWAAAYEAMTGRPVHRVVGRLVAGRGPHLVVGGVALAILGWGWKMLTHVAGFGGTGWW